MKLKKGSKEAAAFMAKLRASRGKKKPAKKLSGVKAKPAKPVYVTILGQRVKVGTKLHSKLVAQKKHFDDLLKSELSGTKKKTVKRSKAKKVHTDVKSHNVKVSVMSGITEENLISEIKTTRNNIEHLNRNLQQATKLLKTRLYTNKKNSYMRANLKDKIKYTKKAILVEKNVLKNLLQIKKIF